ncbi:D-alanine--D-alanine ligase [Devosia neptuniae]|nr:D-alanine--D-alanine ligase family protein [Devosia neptuniae]MCZ4348062.1 D-alanine--D-alanine ligase [Devosia neptuniae]
MTTPRLKIAVLFGGRSAEHDVSVLSATNVMAALAPDKYDLVPIFVTLEGQWLRSHFENGVLDMPEAGQELSLVPGGRGRMILIGADGLVAGTDKIDALFPVLHGLHGEDGSVQGLAAVARVPLVGCGILGSATALDKIIAKQLLGAAGLPVARSVTIRAGEAPEFAGLEDELGLPIFIKPARQGSSVGVSKVSGSQEFTPALAEAFRFDHVILAEEFIEGREIEFSVLEDEKGELFISRPGEIIPAERHGFYSYDAKYVDETGATLKVPADLPPDVETAMRDTAERAFRALGCDGMARVDFFLTPNMQFLVNEVNTIPGFTNISMYAKAMEASGIAYPSIIDRLVGHSLARADRAQ